MNYQYQCQHATEKKIVYVIKSYNTEIFLQIDHIRQNFDREISKNEFVFFHYIN